MAGIKASNFTRQQLSRTLLELGTHLGRLGWSFVIGAAGGAVGFAADANLGLSLQRQHWFLLIVVCVILACFVAFHKVRIERDEARRRRSDSKTISMLGALIEEGDRFEPRDLWGLFDLATLWDAWVVRVDAYLLEADLPEWRDRFAAGSCKSSTLVAVGHAHYDAAVRAMTKQVNCLRELREWLLVSARSSENAGA